MTSQAEVRRTLLTQQIKVRTQILFAAFKKTAVFTMFNKVVEEYTNLMLDNTFSSIEKETIVIDHEINLSVTV